MLHYLQYCYYKTGNILEGANTAKSLTLLSPNDKIAEQNLEFYTGEAKKRGIVNIQPRIDVMKYMRSKFSIDNNCVYGSKYLKYIDEDIVLENENNSETFHIDTEKLKNMIKDSISL
jgi:hypothetical protein